MTQAITTSSSGTGRATLPPMAKSKTVAVRLPEELLERVERRAAAYRERMPPGLPFTTSDVIRVLLERALQVEEAEEKRAGKRRR